MKNVSKYLMMLAVVALGFTACEDEIKRDPSPEFDGKKSIFFPLSEAALEVDPKDAFEYEVTIVRTSKDAEASVKLTVEENTQDVFVVPATVDFAKGQDTTSFVIKFPKAQIDSTYNLFITMDSVVSNPYREELPSFALTVTVAKWEDVTDKKAIAVDGLINVFFSVGNPMWYCSYQRKDNADGSFDIRLLNPYASMASGDPDKFGIYDGYPWNEDGDFDTKGTYNMVIHVSKAGQASFKTFATGIDWSYGMIYGAYYADGGAGVWNKDEQSITFPAGSVLCAMANYKDGAFFDGTEKMIVYIDDAVYQDAHSAIKIASLEGGFNDESIEWNAMAGDLQTVISAVESDSWESQLLNAIDPNEKDKQGEGSDFFNLFMLADMYAPGYGLAFYWDTIKGKVELPASLQPMGQKFASKEMFVGPSAENESYMEEIEVKGSKVQLFHLFVQVQTQDGGNLGEYEELFYYGPNAIVWEEKDYLGDFVLTGPCQFAGYDGLEDTVTIDKEGNDMYILGVPYCDTLWVGFDANTGIMSIETQAVADVEIPTYGTFDATFTTADPTGEPIDAPIELAFGLDGVIKVLADSKADGFYILSTKAGGALDGYYDLRFTPVPVDEKANIAPRTYVQKFAAAKKAHRTAKRAEHKFQIIGQLPRHNFRLLK